MPDPDGVIQDSDLTDGFISPRHFSSTGIAVPDVPVHFKSIRLSTSTGAIGSSGTPLTLIRRHNIRLYTGDSKEIGPGTVFAGVAGSSAGSTDRQLLITIEAPTGDNTDPGGGPYPTLRGAMSFTLFEAAVDDSLAAEARVSYNGGSTKTGIMNFSGVSVKGDMIFSTTDSGAANVVVTSTGGLHRNASALKYKPDWRLAPPLATRTLPDPIVWDEGRRLGYGAEHVAAAVPEAAAFEQYHLAGIVAILQHKVERVERHLGLQKEDDGLDST